MIHADDDPISSLFAGGAPSGWEIVFAVLAVVVGWVVSIFARRGVLALAKRWNGVSPQLAQLVARIIMYGIVLLAIGVALSFLGAPIQPILAAAIIVAVVVVLALRGIADNFAAGIVLQTRRPITIGDEIEVADVSGTVTDINGRSVVIRTHDGKTVHVPNAQVLSQPLYNNSTTGALRSELQVRLAGDGAASASARERLLAATADIDGVHKRPAPSALLTAASADRAVYLVRVWHHPRHRTAALDGATRSIIESLRDDKLRVSVTWPLPPVPLIEPFDP